MLRTPSGLRTIAAGFCLLFLLSVVAPADARKRRRRRKGRTPVARKAPEPPKPPPMDPAKAAAIQLLQSGLKKLNEGRYYDAIKDFQQGLKKFPSPSFHYNIALAYGELKNDVRALESYEAYAIAYGQQDAAWKKANVQNFRIAQNWQKLLLQRIAVVQVVVVDKNKQPLADSTIIVDGVTVGKSPLAKPVRLQPVPGKRFVIEVEKADYQPFKKRLAFQSGQRATIHVKLITKQDHQRQQAEYQRLQREALATKLRLERERRATEERQASRRRAMRLSGWIGIGVGIALGTLAGVTGIISLVDRLYVEGAEGEPEYTGDYPMRYDRSFTLSKVALSSLGIGAAIAIGGGILVWLSKRGAESDSPNKAGEIKPGVSVLPTVGPDGAGVSFQLRF